VNLRGKRVPLTDASSGIGLQGSAESVSRVIDTEWGHSGVHSTTIYYPDTTPDQSGCVDCVLPMRGTVVSPLG
jgi:hypothetical protein